VICTGFTYDAPIRQDGVYYVNDRKKGMINFYNQVQSAKNIAVVGGGIVGVELAGELACLPNASEKKISLIVRQDRLLK
jgi:NADH dehydrogenase FAD-containing subunit